MTHMWLWGWKLSQEKNKLKVYQEKKTIGELRLKEELVVVAFSNCLLDFKTIAYLEERWHNVLSLLLEEKQAHKEAS